ncbi:hypothetical protein ZIOFF_055797 [Zingiber officinale]|uniref:Uncharacterized protein n=1 Tax=Zingiber officinale TaxID=94328 RepID=A0A8J5FME3_ZINOF|nr:hypothetical protein ZIOFF_055797 [Zingiber officinale]
MEVNRRRKWSFTSLREDLRETFLPKDPFRYCLAEVECHQSSRSTLMLTYLVTILEWGPKYNLAKFQCDLLVGFTVAILTVLQRHQLRLPRLPSPLHRPLFEFYPTVNLCDIW